MPQAGGCDAASIIRRLSMRSFSTKITKLRVMQDGRTRPEDARRIAHMHAALRRRTRVDRIDSEDVRSMADRGLISRPEGGGPPAVTPVGRWSAAAYEMGITFFEMCVLAKVYGVARSMAGTREESGADGARTATIPLKTIQYFFEDWPVYPGRVQHALSRLRGRGLIPRSRRRRIACDMARLDAIRGDLLEVSKWVDDTGEEIRRVLLHGY